MVAIIDYDAGNIKSVENAVKVLGQAPILTRDPKTILSADHIILPGVGAFGDAMERIRSYGLEDPIREAVSRNIPFLGICLGLQLLFDSSEESPGVSGLGLISGRILRFPENQVGVKYKVPEIGWNNLEYVNKGRLFEGIPEGSHVYFVHSYYAESAEDVVTARSTYAGVDFDASVEKGNLFACQFHPEKSERVGMRILRNFLSVR